MLDHGSWYFSQWVYTNIWIWVYEYNNQKKKNQIDLKHVGIDYTMLFHSKGKGVDSSAPCSKELKVTVTADGWLLSDVNRSLYWQAFLSPVVHRYIWNLSENTLTEQMISWCIVLSACLYYCQGGQRRKYCTSFSGWFWIQYPLMLARNFWLMAIENSDERQAGQQLPHIS